MFGIRGNTTTERITNASTFKGIATASLGIIGIRLASIFLLIPWAALVGRGAPFLLLAVVLMYSPLFRRLRRNFPPIPPRWLAGMSAFSALMFVSLATKTWFNLRWEIGGGLMWITTQRGSYSVGPFWIWARAASIIALPYSMYKILEWTTWALRSELLYPKLRESVPQLVIPAALVSPDGALEQRNNARIVTQKARQPTGDPAPPDYNAHMVVE
jgi:hypothetical protein